MLLHKELAGASDILEITDHSNKTNSVVFQLHNTSTMCGRSSRVTAVHEIEVIILEEGDKKLTLPKTHGNDLDQWTFTKSLILSADSSTELAAGQDFRP